MNIPFDVTNVKIETDRLVLRPFCEADLQDFFEYASVPGVGEMAGWPHHKSAKESKVILDLFLAERDVFAIYHKADKKVIGSLGLHNRHTWADEDERYDHLRLKEIGYVLSKAYWGQGLVVEAVKAVIDYGFNKLGLEAFSCCHFLENHRSKRVIEKCGFVFVKEDRFYSKLMDKHFDDMAYILLKDGVTANPLASFYSRYDEQGRLEPNHGRVEFLTTMRYVEKYLTPGSKVIEIGAGTGRYSCAIADMGYEVQAIELFNHNIDIFKENLKPSQKINITQGNALDLSNFSDDLFDITLLFGPMYHLYTNEDKKTALSEALRVTKSGGIVFVAYCISDSSIVNAGFMRTDGFSVADYIARGKIDPVTFDTTSTPEDIFELVRKEDIDTLLNNFDVERLHYVATDLFTHYIRDTIEAMDTETFDLYLKYHFAVCERSDMVGITNHSLDIFKKDSNIGEVNV